jgi:hypothetical protein
MKPTKPKRLPGQNYATGHDIAGNAFVAGVTSSSDFPTTPGAYRSPTVSTTQGEVFVAKLDASGSAFSYSTLIGAGHVYAIAIDSAGSAYLTGHTNDATYPTVNPVQADLLGEVDAFVTKLDPTGSALVYSTYLGGTGDGLFWFVGDTGHGIAVDPEGNAYVSGQTDSPDFPTTIGARQPLYGGGSHDGFITKLDAAGSTIVYSTFLGGAAADGARSLALDALGRVTVAGFTQSVNFPTAQALQPQHASDNGDTDAFVARLDASGSQLLYSTYLGGNSSDVATGVAVDQAGNTYVIGTTLATDFPTVRPLGPSFADGAASEAFVTKLGPTGSSMLYSTYLGGDGVELGDAIAVEALGSAYVTGSTFAPSAFPTVNPFQPVSGGGIDAFVAKIADPCPEDVTSQLGVFGFPPVPIPFIPISVQWVILWNPTPDPIPGPLAFVMDDLQNAIFIGSPLTTRCAPFDGDPFTVVAAGSDGVLSPGEAAVAVLWFLKTGTGRIRYEAHVLAGLPTQ